MNSKYLFLYLLTLSVFVGCTTCEECGNLYYEPGIRLVFLKTGGKDSDSLKTIIKSFNGKDTVLNFNISKQDLSVVFKANYYLPLRMDSSSTTYNLNYEMFNTEIKKTTAGKDSIVYSLYKKSSKSFTVDYKLEQYFSNDRFLQRAIIDTIRFDTLKFKKSIGISCYDCDNHTASIYIYE